MKQLAEATPWKADLALAGICLIWGGTFVVVKDALAYVSTLLFLALRFSLGAAALAMAFRGRRLKGASWVHTIRAGGLAGVCLFSGFFLQTLGLRYTTASKSAFITGLSVVMVPLCSSIVYRYVPRLPEWAGVAVAFTGMALLTLKGGSLRIGVGDLLTLAGAAGFAAHILVVGHFSRTVPVEGLSLLQITVAALIAAGTFWWVEEPRIVWTSAVLSAVGITGLLATALAFTIQVWAQQHTSTTHTALIFALEPVFAAIVSFLVEGEVLNRRALAGAALILFGILLVELKPAGPGRHRFAKVSHPGNSL
jgi:drug/metabolite transporter (DMT)-like permease